MRVALRGDRPRARRGGLGARGARPARRARSARRRRAGAGRAARRRAAGGSAAGSSASWRGIPVGLPRRVRAARRRRPALPDAARTGTRARDAARWSTINDAHALGPPGVVHARARAARAAGARAGRCAPPPWCSCRRRTRASALLARVRGLDRERVAVTPYGVDPRFSPGRRGDGGEPVPAHGRHAAAAQEPRSGAARVRAPATPTQPPRRRRARAAGATMRCWRALRRSPAADRIDAARPRRATTSSSRSTAAPSCLLFPSRARGLRLPAAGGDGVRHAGGRRGRRSLPEVPGDAAPLVDPDDDAGLAAAVAARARRPGPWRERGPGAGRAVQLGALRGADGRGVSRGGAGVSAPAHVGINALYLVPGEGAGRRPTRASSSPRSQHSGPRRASPCSAAARPGPPCAPRAGPGTCGCASCRSRCAVKPLRAAAEQTLLPAAVARAGVELLATASARRRRWPAGRPAWSRCTTSSRTSIQAPSRPRRAGACACSCRPAPAGPTASRSPPARPARRCASGSGCRRRAVDVVPLGLGMRPPERPTPEGALRARLALGDGPVVLSVAAALPHKNLGPLLRRSRRSRAGGAARAGRPRRTADGPSAGAGRALGVAERVRFCGWVSAEDLEGLYAAAAAFVYPSLDEGFGLPVLEAMRRGVPRRAATHVAAGGRRRRGAALRPALDGRDRGGAADAAGRCGGRELAARGPAQAARFGWDRTATAAWESRARHADEQRAHGSPVGALQRGERRRDAQVRAVERGRQARRERRRVDPSAVWTRRGGRGCPAGSRAPRPAPAASPPASRRGRRSRAARSRGRAARARGGRAARRGRRTAPSASGCARAGTTCPGPCRSRSGARRARRARSPLHPASRSRSNSSRSSPYMK